MPVFVWCSLYGGEGDGNGGTLAWGAGELYLAVVVLYRVLYYGKAKPGTVKKRSNMRF